MLTSRPDERRLWLVQFPAVHTGYARNDVAIRIRLGYILRMQKTEIISVRMAPELRIALKRAAEADGRPLSSMLVKLATDWAKAHGWLKETKP